MIFCSVVMSDTPVPLAGVCEVADGCDYAPLRHARDLSSVIVKVSDQFLVDFAYMRGRLFLLIDFGC
jgi:hypothetical protein